MPFLLATLLAAVPADPPPPAPMVARMAALYEEICLRTFPIDAQVDALMAAKGATPLTPDQVKVTLTTDPGRGWAIREGDVSILVFLELPPFHACSVRAPVGSGPVDLAPYRTAVAPFIAGHPGFRREKPMDADIGAVRAHMENELRALPGGGTQSLMVIDQHVTDPARRAKGETGTMLRFVHQIRMPG